VSANTPGHLSCFSSATPDIINQPWKETMTRLALAVLISSLTLTAAVADSGKDQATAKKLAGAALNSFTTSQAEPSTESQPATQSQPSTELQPSTESQPSDPQSEYTYPLPPAKTPGEVLQRENANEDCPPFTDDNSHYSNTLQQRVCN